MTADVLIGISKLLLKKLGQKSVPGVVAWHASHHSNLPV